MSVLLMLHLLNRVRKFESIIKVLLLSNENRQTKLRKKTLTIFKNNLKINELSVKNIQYNLHINLKNVN